MGYVLRGDLWGRSSKLNTGENNMEQIIPIQRQKIVYLEKKDYLESEKKNFLLAITQFFDNLEEKKVCTNGRPCIYVKDMLKSLLIMSYNGMSYRRARGDLEIAKTLGVINAIPKRSTLCKYMGNEEIKERLEKLIQQSALYFLEGIHTLIVDSTWFPLKANSSGHNKKPYDRKKGDKFIPPLEKTRKIHIGIIKDSRIIAFAKTSKGTAHDSPFCKEIISTIIDNGFMINTLLGDAGYLSKDNYAFAQKKGVENIFIDFRSNVTGKRAKSQAWRDAFFLYKKDNEYWHEIYRFRVLIESVFSSIKRKFMNWLRMKNEIARDNEMLLKILAYNLTILGKRY